MSRKYIFSICLFVILPFFAFSQKAYSEFVEEEFIKTLNLYSYSNTEDASKRYINSAVVNLDNPNQRLVLEFDDIRAEYAQYKIKIVHCEVDWSRSRLLDMEFLSEPNELFLSDFQISQSTKIPYYHYRFVLPKTKISGNFVMQLYADDQLVAQKKFWVYEMGGGIAVNVTPAVDPEFWKTHQQLNLKLDFGTMNLGVFQREMKVMIRKNQHEWKEINNNHFTNTGRNTYVLQQFDNDYLFPGGNEFRFLDITSSFRKGQNVHIIELGRPDILYTYPQGLRSNLTYTKSYDNDGGYLIQNIEQTDPDITSDYVNVVFRLKPVYEDLSLKPTLYGKLTNWEDVLMEFNPHSEMYETELLLKNGIYDFQFGLDTNGEIDRNFFEGDFSQTGNTYEVFLYYTSPGKRHSALIGYQFTRFDR